MSAIHSFITRIALAIAALGFWAPAHAQTLPTDIEAVFTDPDIQRYPVYYARTPADSAEAVLAARDIVGDNSEAAKKYGGFPFTSRTLSDEGIEGTPSYWLANLPTEVDGVELVLKFRGIDIADRRHNPLQFMLGNSPDGYLWLGIDQEGELLISKRTREGWDDYVEAGEFPATIDWAADNELHVIWLESGRYFVKLNGKSLFSGDARGAIPADVPLIGRSNRMVVRGEIAFEEILLNQLIVADGEDSDPMPPGLTFSEVLQLADAAFAGEETAVTRAFYISQELDLRERAALALGAESGAPGLPGGLVMTLKVGPDGRVYRVEGANAGALSPVNPGLAAIAARLPEGWRYDREREWLVPPR